MDINKLITYKTLCETKSYTETSRILGITQSAVSQQIKALQDQYNDILVQKINNFFQLTPKGRALFFEISSPLSELMHRIQSFKDNSTTQTIIKIMGAEQFLINKFIPQINKNKKLESINFEIHFANSTITNKELIEGNIDIGFVSTPLPERLATSKVIHQEKMILVANPKLKITKNLTLIDMSSNKRLFIEWLDKNFKSLKKHKINLSDSNINLKMIIPNMAGIIAMVKSSEHAAIVPEYLVSKEIKNKELINIYPFANEYINDLYITILKKQKSGEINQTYMRLAEVHSKN